MMEMKCICGYEYVRHWDEKEIPNKGDEEFIKINGHFTITRSIEYGGDRVMEVSLYACPECNTVQMDW